MCANKMQHEGDRANEERGGARLDGCTRAAEGYKSPLRRAAAEPPPRPAARTNLRVHTSNTMLLQLANHTSRLARPKNARAVPQAAAGTTRFANHHHSRACSRDGRVTSNPTPRAPIAWQQQQRIRAYLALHEHQRRRSGDESPGGMNAGYKESVVDFVSRSREH